MNQNRNTRRVVVTGLGIVSPIGNDTEACRSAVREAKCGIAPITLYDTAERKVKLAGEVKDLALENYIPKREQRRMDRSTQFAIAAAVQAFADAGIEEQPAEENDRVRYGCIFGSGIGGIGTIESEHSRGLEKGFDRVSPNFIPMCIANMPAGQISLRYHLHGICSSSVTACASAANAIGDAFHYIRDGYADLMLCGGTEAAITPLAIGGFTSMKALSESEDPLRASIPFDKERNGFVMGEGAGALVIEEYEHAVKRGAKIYAEITGYGASCDAHHITAPDPEGTWAARSMQNALDDAGISAENVDYINAHGTSTHLNDAGETKAIRKVLGDAADKVKVSSTKSMTGHLLGASAAVEAVLTVLAISDSFVPPTIGYRVPDEECDLDYVPGHGYDYEIKTALSNSFGFGGHNCTLCFSRFE